MRTTLSKRAAKRAAEAEAQRQRRREADRQALRRWRGVELAPSSGVELSEAEAEALTLAAERLAELSAWQRADRRRSAVEPLAAELTEAQR